MELDVDLFGDREAASVRGSDGESDRGSDGEEEEQQRNVWGNDTEEQDGAAGGGEEAAEAPAPQPIKPKRVVANPLPKLDAHRLAGPRGMFALNRICRNFKFKGKGHEHEDLKEVLKVLEHWAHRLYPKLPFKDTLEQIEKLGTKKNVQVNIKKLRLDMFVEGSEEGEEDNVRRGVDDDNSETTPVVDVFDELLGITPSAHPATTTTTTTTTAPIQTVLPPASQSPKPATQLTEEQRERMERNRKLAIEKRLARLQQQQQQQQEQEKEESSGQQEMTSSQEMDYFDKLPGTGRSLGTSEDRREKSNDTELMDLSQERRETQETLDKAELMDGVVDNMEGSQERGETQDTLDEAKLMDGAADKKEDPQEGRERQETLNETELLERDGEKSESPNDRRQGQDKLSDTEEPMDVILNILKDSKERSEAQGQEDTENMDAISDKLKDIEERRKTPGEAQNTEEEMDVILDKLQGSEHMASSQEERREAPSDK